MNKEYFGGKSSIAARVWALLGDPDNYIEPFYGSGATLLLRPHPPKVETVNDADCMVSNFWRATQAAPDEVAAYADGPVNEADLHSRHRWLVLSDDAAAFRQKMRTDPDYFDAKVAGWWCWGLCCWIGGGWCSSEPGEANCGPAGGSGERHPSIDDECGRGVHSHAAGSAALRQKRPRAPRNEGDPALPGVHGAPEGEASTEPGLSPGRRPMLPGYPGQIGEGVHAKGPPLAQGRPQLADAYDIGRGVHAGGGLSQQIPMIGASWRQNTAVPECSRLGAVNRGPVEGTCAARRTWLVDWFSRLRDRLRLVRVCCGDWSRICSSDSVLTRLGVTGVFLDPPYPRHQKKRKNSRSGGLYATDAASHKSPEATRDELLAWCIEHGGHKLMRVVVAGYEGDGYEMLVRDHGWREEEWQASGGYGNRTDNGKANARRERLWSSPHCEVERTLFDALESPA